MSLNKNGKLKNYKEEKAIVLLPSENCCWRFAIFLSLYLSYSCLYTVMITWLYVLLFKA